MPKNLPIKYLPNLPCLNPRYVPGGQGEKLPPTSAKWGVWREPVSPQGYGLGYLVWFEIEIPNTRK